MEKEGLPKVAVKSWTVMLSMNGEEEDIDAV